MNTEPLKKYILARDEFRNGNKDTALKLLADSIGAEKPTPIMTDSLGKLVDLNDAALTLILHRMKEEK